MSSLGAGTWIIDLDGVVWLAGTPIPGAKEAIGRLRDADIRVLFVTNNSAPTLEELVARLQRAGIAATAEDLVTSAQAAAELLESGDRAVALADGGATQALLARGVEIVEHGPADAVVVGWTHDFDFERLTLAARVVRAGARLIGTNEDSTHPTPDGLLPGSGAILAAVATAADTVPEVAGKPHPPIVGLIARRTDDVSLVVGDRPTTDGALAGALGVPFALVLSGVTASVADELPAPAYCARDLLALVTGLLGQPTAGGSDGLVQYGGPMSEDDGWKRYVEAANALGQLARARVEEIARDLLASGGSESDQARQWTEDLLERSRSVVDDVVEVVRAEVTKQLETLGLGSPEDLFRRLSETLGKPVRPRGAGPRADAVLIDASSVPSSATTARAKKSEATGAVSKQRTSKPKGADKKKPEKTTGVAKKGVPRSAAKAAQKNAQSAPKTSVTKKSAPKKSVTKKSAGRST